MDTFREYLLSEIKKKNTNLPVNQNQEPQSDETHETSETSPSQDN